MYDKSFLLGILESWRRDSIEQKWKQRAGLLLNAITLLERSTLAFTQEENDFFKNFYIEFNDAENPLKILSLGCKFQRAEIFYTNKFVENNLAAFYSDCSFRDQILEQKPNFVDKKNVCVDNICEGNINNIVSYYIFIENITKHFGDSVNGDREKKGNFKKKLVIFYEAIFKLFNVLNNKELIKNYFNMVLHNQPMFLIEMINTIFLSQDLSKISSVFGDEFKFFGNLNGNQFEVLKNDIVYGFISILSIKNKHINVCMFTKNSKEILEVLCNVKISSFEDYCKAGVNFIKDFKPYPNAELSEDVKLLFSSLFFEYILGFENAIKDQNIIYSGAIGTGKTHKIKEIVKIKNVPLNRRRYVQFHSNYKYEDFMDGFDENGDFRNGEFKEFCKIASKDLDNEYFFIINNINGADSGKIFGEAFDLLDNRISSLDDTDNLIRTKNSHIIDHFDEAEKEEFSVIVKDGLSYFAIPNNIFIIASHNSYECHDLTQNQLTKHFKWINLVCNYNVLIQWLNEAGVQNATNYARTCMQLNNYIRGDLALGDRYEIGHEIFAKIIAGKEVNEITQKNLSDFFDSVLSPILMMVFSNLLGYKDALRCIKTSREIFKFD